MCYILLRCQMGAPGWTIQGVYESSDKQRKVNVSKIVKIKHTI